jgi:hypothetical protein
MIKKENKNVIYYDNYSNIKDLKYKDFLNRIDEIKLIDVDQALSLLDK